VGRERPQPGVRRGDDLLELRREHVRLEPHPTGVGVVAAHDAREHAQLLELRSAVAGDCALLLRLGGDGLEPLQPHDDAHRGVSRFVAITER
jgi:hypothetical protein